MLVAGCQTRPIPERPIPVPPAPACTNQNLAPEALFREARPGVVVVLREAGTGSGFVVRHQNGRTLILTNAHVVEGTDAVTVKWADGSQDSAAVVSDAGGETPLTDLALLEVRGIRGTPLRLRSTKPNVGAEVVAIGAPQGLEFSLTRGVVSSLRDNAEILQIDAPINPGNSGGPLIDRTGCVVGVVTFKLEGSEGLNFAIATSTVERFLANPVAPRPPAPPINPGQPGPAQPDQANPSTCWFQLSEGASRLEGSRCRVSSRVNSNGHTVFDVVEPNGLTRTVVLWEGSRAEVLVKGQTYEGEWMEDEDGDIRVEVNGGVFAFSPPT
ncbi:MAG: S1C family serine protease [Cyanobacteriota bacterium]|nr:S1C family serine protease [Cyanobacteriota bacterium]